MRRRDFMMQVGMLAAGLTSGCQTAFRRDFTNGVKCPNILLILSDDHSVPDLSCYGNANLSTPNIDFLANNGIRFNRMYTTAPQCAPSRKSILTGRSPISMRCSRFTTPLPRDVPTVMELLRKRNYYTGLLGRDHHLDGFDHSEETKRVYAEHRLNTAAERTDKIIGFRGDATNHEVLAEFLDAVPAGRPFFAQLSYSNPHRLFTAQEKFIPDPTSIVVPERYPDTPAVRADLAQYYGEIQELDSYIGRAWDELRKRGLMDNTLILFMGDNGSALLRGKNTLYEPGTNVVMLAYWKGNIEAGRTTDAIISGEDITPTLLDIAGVSVPNEVSGISFRPILEGKAASTRKFAFAERGGHGNALPGNNSGFDIIRSVVGERYKLIYNGLGCLPQFTPVADCWQSGTSGYTMLKDLETRLEEGTLPEKYASYFRTPRPTFEMYDLQEDPFEFHNIHDKEPYAAEQQELKRALNNWMILQWDDLQLPIVE